MIDDKIENLLALKERIQVICYPSAWNEGKDDEQFIRVGNWNDIYECISSIGKD